MFSSASFRSSAIAAALLALVPAAAFAHPGGIATAHDFQHGFLHPLSGADHLLAMVAVGLWAAQRQGRSVWALPAAFVGFMIVGFIIGVAGIPMPAVELGIAASVLVLGIAVALAIRLPTAGAVALVGIFALFHGHAHGAELPAGMLAGMFGTGFAASTALLHAAGIALATGVRKLATAPAAPVRVIGAGIAAAGVVLLLV